MVNGEFVSDEHTSYTGQAESDWRYYHAKSPITPYPLLVVNGYLGCMEAYVPFAQQCASRGLDTVIMEPPRRQKRNLGLHPDHFLHPERLLAQMTGRIARDIIEKYDFEKVDVTGHSMGTPAIVEAAERWPERFHSVTLNGGAGMTEHDFLTLVRRMPKAGLGLLGCLPELRTNFELRSILPATVKYIATNPIRTVGEGIAVTQSNIRPSLAKLGSLSIQRAAILFTGDELFPYDEALELCGNDLEAVRILPYQHTGPQTHPDETAIAQAEILQQFGSIPRAA